MIKTKDLTRTYGKGDGKVTALDGVSLTINDGEMVAIIGKSGSGKSTLLNLLGGLDKPTSGQIFFGDKELGSMKDKELAEVRLTHIGFLFSVFALIP